MQLTGLSRTDATLVKMREYDELYLLEGPPALIDEVCLQIVMRGLRWTKGGRLYHLTGDNDKGEAAELLLVAIEGNSGCGIRPTVSRVSASETVSTTHRCWLSSIILSSCRNPTGPSIRTFISRN